MSEFKPLDEGEIILAIQCAEAAVMALESVEKCENIFGLDGFAEYGGNDRLRDIRTLIMRLEAMRDES